MTIQVNLTGINELDFPTGVASASTANGVTTINLSGSGVTGPAGATGAIQFNNSGVFGGSGATATADGSLGIPTGQAVNFAVDGSFQDAGFTFGRAIATSLGMNLN